MLCTQVLHSESSMIQGELNYKNVEGSASLCTNITKKKYISIIFIYIYIYIILILNLYSGYIIEILWKFKY